MAKKLRNLGSTDIVTSTHIGRRSALQLIGGTVAAGTSGLVTGARPASAGPTDVTIVGDPKADNDLGSFSDPPGDTDPTIFSDTVGAVPRGNVGNVGDGDTGGFGDPVDTDTGRSADAGDSDVTEISDFERRSQNRQGGQSGVSDPQDNDFATLGDPIPARDKDPSDMPLVDSDETRAADAADTD